MNPRRGVASGLLALALALAWGAGFGLGAAEPLRVACVGDSITEGAGLANPLAESYPARVQRLLGTNQFLVRNFGVSGRTLLRKGDFPYWREAFYTQSRAWGPDVVLLKLGTNDSKPQNWRHGTNFVTDLEDLVASYRTLDSAPRVILCTPAPVYGRGAFDISPGIVATNIVPIVRAVADRLGLEVLDFHTALSGHPEWFPDTVHPNTRGMAVMAARVAQQLRPASTGAPVPDLYVQRSAAHRPVISWPATAVDVVVQSSPATAGVTAVWTVVDPPPVSDGQRLRLTNSAAAPRFFRLWRP